MSKQAFENSKELKRIFNEQYAVWRKRQGGTLEELAQLCGVTASYLGHIGRYGRVPGRPVLILLAFNFGLDSPQVLFNAAGVDQPWPYEEGTHLLKKGESDHGFLSLRVDMQGFTESIRQIVRSEVRPRSVRDLTRGKALRVAYNFAQAAFFNQDSLKGGMAGFFPDLFQMFSLSLQARIEQKTATHLECFEKFQNNELDLFGPIYSSPPRIGKAIFSRPFLRVAVTGLGRKRKADALVDLPHPTSLADLRGHEYQIAVLAETASHHYALTHLEGGAAKIIVCETPNEVLERISLASIPRPAHLAIADAINTVAISRKYPKEYEPLFSEADNVLSFFEDTIAVRSDWPELVQIVNEAIEFLSREGSIQRSYLQYLAKDYGHLIQVPSI